jgi:N-methylhydantoinase B
VVVPADWSIQLHESGALVLKHERARVKRARAASDAIESQIAANALATIADEMATTVFRTAHSAVVRDAMDFSAALCGPSSHRETYSSGMTRSMVQATFPTCSS